LKYKNKKNIFKKYKRYKNKKNYIEYFEYIFFILLKTLFFKELDLNHKTRFYMSIIIEE